VQWCRCLSLNSVAAVHLLRIFMFSSVWWPSLTLLSNSAPCCCLEKRGSAGEEGPERTVEIVQILRGQHYATNLQKKRGKFTCWQTNKQTGKRGHRLRCQGLQSWPALFLVWSSLAWSTILCCIIVSLSSVFVLRNLPPLPLYTLDLPKLTENCIIFTEIRCLISRRSG